MTPKTPQHGVYELLLETCFPAFYQQLRACRSRALPLPLQFIPNSFPFHMLLMCHLARKPTLTFRLSDGLPEWSDKQECISQCCWWLLRGTSMSKFTKYTLHTQACTELCPCAHLSLCSNASSFPVSPPEQPGIQMVSCLDVRVLCQVLSVWREIYRSLGL